jgi:hypothetical protein
MLEAGSLCEYQVFDTKPGLPMTKRSCGVPAQYLLEGNALCASHFLMQSGASAPYPTFSFRKQLDTFRDLMASQTTRNWHKGGREAWLKDGVDFDKYLLEAQINLQELRIALAYGKDVGEKAADVANDVFYLWDAFQNNIGGVLT